MKVFVLAIVFLTSTPGALRAESFDQFGRSHEIAAVETYTVVDFAASWCEPCYRALPRLQALAGAHPGIRFLVISVDDEVAGRDRLVRDLDLRLPVIWDEGHAIIESFRPSGFPATYVLDSAGEILHQHIGYSKKKWQRLLEVLARLEVAEPSPAVRSPEGG